MSFKSFEAPPPLDNQNIRGREQENNLDPAEVVGDGINWMEKNIEKEKAETEKSKTRVGPNIDTETESSCSKCGALTLSGANFCTECGNKLEGKELKKLNKAIEQSKEFLRTDAFCEEPVSGVRLYGSFPRYGTKPLSYKEIYSNFKVFNIDMGEIIVLDPEIDPKLKEMSRWAKKLGENPDLSINEKAFIVAQKVYKEMGGNNSLEISIEVEKREKERIKGSGEELIGEIAKGRCFPRSILFHALFSKIGKEVGEINSTLRGGYVIREERIAAHAWCEFFDNNGELRVVDIMNPPSGFKDNDYKQFKRRGGFPCPRDSRLAYPGSAVRYCNSKGIELYEGIMNEEEFLKESWLAIKKEFKKEAKGLSVAEVMPEIQSYFQKLREIYPGEEVLKKKLDRYHEILMIQKSSPNKWIVKNHLKKEGYEDL